MRVRTAAVVGAGTMGAAIAELLAFNGIEVQLKDVDRTRVDRGLGQVRGLVSELVRFHAGRAEAEVRRLREYGLELSPSQLETVHRDLGPKVSAERGEEIVARVRGVTEYEGFGDVDLAIEAVFVET